MSEKNSVLLFIAKFRYKNYIHFRIFQGNKTNKENMHLKRIGNYADAIDTTQKQIKFISNHFNFANI